MPRLPCSVHTSDMTLAQTTPFTKPLGFIPVYALQLLSLFETLRVLDTVGLCLSGIALFPFTAVRIGYFLSSNCQLGTELVIEDI